MSSSVVIEIDALLEVTGSYEALLGLIYARRNREIYERCKVEKYKAVAWNYGLSESRVKAIVAEVDKHFSAEVDADAALVRD